MPLFTPGATRQARIRKEESLVPGAQKDSLTFVERGTPRPKFTGSNPSLGLLLEGHTGTFFQPGATRRTAPRSQMSSRSGWEFQKPVAISGNQANIELLYNPSLRLHRELAAVSQLEEFWRVVTFMSPPFMNCVAGEFMALSASGGGITAEESETMTVAVVDQFGAEYITGMLWQSDTWAESGGTVTYGMKHIPESPTLAGVSTSNINLTVTEAGAVSFTIGATAADATAKAVFLLNVPGIGYALSDEIAGTAINSALTAQAGSALGAILTADDAESIPVFAGVYLDTSGVALFR